MSNTKNIVKYFHGLDGLRFVGAFIVIVRHINIIEIQLLHKDLKAGSTLDPEDTYNLIGELAVTLFFVLSGFLISYMLMYEKDKSGSIDLKKFYLKRILRIWPLHFLMIIYCGFIMPYLVFLYNGINLGKIEHNFWIKIGLYTFMMPHIAFITKYSIPLLVQTWTTGVEETFYFSWPLFIRRIKENFHYFFLAVLVLYLIISVSLGAHSKFINPYPEDSQALRVLRNFVYYTRLSCMAIGGLGAYLVFFHKEKILNYLYTYTVQIVTYILILAGFYFGIYVPHVHHELYSMLFVIVILNIATNPKSILKLRDGLTNYLGRLSYGLYIFHFIVIPPFINCSIHYLGITFQTKLEIAYLYVGVFVTTILVSMISFYLFEKPFVNLREKYLR